MSTFYSICIPDISELHVLMSIILLLPAWTMWGLKLRKWSNFLPLKRC